MDVKVQFELLDLTEQRSRTPGAMESVTGGHEKHHTFPLAKAAILTVILGLFAVHTSLIFTAVTQDFYSRITDMKT